MQNEETIKAADTRKPTGSEITKGRKAGFRQDNTPYPGVDPVTGERKAVTLRGLEEELGDRPKALQVYNAIAVTGFGGVPHGRNDLNILSLKDEYTRQDVSDERKAFKALRRARVYDILRGAGLGAPGNDTAETKE